MTDLKCLGARGETRAAEYLVQRGYKIITRNYRTGHKEIDLIAQGSTGVVFVEVKTRIKTEASRQENPLTEQQVRRLKLALLDYCYSHHLKLEQMRLDLIIILVDKTSQRAELRHYQNIY
jgi:putative endonuclease